jgi:predicted metal-dependent peptidase
MSEQRITASRARLLLSLPFFGTIIMHLSPAASGLHQTMATNGKTLFWNPAWVAGLTDAELDGVMVHEALHVALLHHQRYTAITGGDKNQHNRWNVAADHAVNLILIEAGIVIPEGGACNKKYRGWSSEKIFYDLPEGNFGPGIGVVLAGESGAAELARVRDIVVQAAAAAQSRGQFPAALARLIDDVCAPPVEWPAALVDWAQDNRGRDDVSCKRFSRRWLAHDMYRPAPHSPSHGTIAIAVDTSGSIDARALSKFWATTRDAVDQAGAQRLVCIACDAAAHLVGDWERHDIPDIPPSFEGGGGTDFAPAFLLANKYDIEGLIFLTDMQGNFPEIPPHYPVLWCSVLPAQSSPFGRTIYIGD